MLVEFRYGIENRQAGARCPFGVVVMRLGIAEECHHAVAKVLGDIPAEALDSLGRRAMILADDFPPLFSVQMARYLGRAYEIAKQYRQVPPFAG